MLATHRPLAADHGKSLFRKALRPISLAFLFSATIFAQPYAYVANSGSNDIAVIDLAQNRVVADPSARVGPTGLAAVPGFAVATLQSTNQLAIIDTSTNGVSTVVGVGGQPVAVAVAVTSRGAFAYVVNQGSNNVSVVSIPGGSVVATIPVGSRPSGIAVDAAGSKALVANTWSTFMTVIDTASNTTGSITVPQGLGQVVMNAAGTVAYATNQYSDSVAVIDPVGKSLTRQFSVPGGSGPAALALTSDGGRLFVANANTSSVSILSTSSGAILGTAGVGAFPAGVAFSPDNTKAYVTNTQSFTVSVIDAGSYNVTATIPGVGVYPTGIVVAPGGSLSLPAATTPPASAPPPAPPTAGPVTMSSSSGTDQVFNASYSDGAGFANIKIMYLLINSTFSSSNACFVYYFRPTNVLYLVDDSSSGVSGQVTPGVNGTAQNGQCVISGTGSTASGSGNTFNLQVNVHFKASATNAIYSLVANAQSLNSGWQQRGSFTSTSVVPGVSADTVSPASGSGTDQTFSFNYSDGQGYSALKMGYFLFNSALDGSKACFVYYYRPTNVLYLVDDSGSGAFGPVTPGQNTPVANTQCSLNGIGTSVTTSGNTLTLNIALHFNSGFSGSKSVYMLANDMAGVQTTWQSRGGWLVP